MIVRKVKKKDLEQIRNWYLKRGEPDQTLVLSDIGFIVDNVAAAFLYTTNSPICMFEAYITNPETNKDERKEALDLITNKLFETAKNMNFKTIISLVNNKATHQRCLDYGFFEINYKPMMRILEEFN